MKLKERLNQRARELQVAPRRLLQHYAMERFLYRLSLSPYAGRLFLKGGMLLAGMGSSQARTTMDIDLLGRISNSGESIKKAFSEIVRTKPGVQDGISFGSAFRLQEITKDALYVGIRVMFDARVAGEALEMKVDIGFSDEIFPEPQELDYPCTLPELPAAHVLCYSKESLIAEKWEAIVKLNRMNSRMKDFYDLWFLSHEQSFEYAPLREAIGRTFEHRGTDPAAVAELKQEVYIDAMRAEWATYIRKMKADTFHRKPPLALPPKEFEDVLAYILSWLEPVMTPQALRRWKPGKGWQA